MAPAATAFNLSTCARPNILALQPYRCARDDYKDDGTNVLLDANENAYGPGLEVDDLAPSSSNGGLEAGSGDIDFLRLNRYPDPHQVELKQLLCRLRTTHAHTAKTLRPENIFVGVGSDEAIDAIIRCFCIPGHDRILTCPPTYGMYAVSAQVNDVEIVKVPLDTSNGFKLQPDKIKERLSSDAQIKLVYICSPGNPTANLAAKQDVQEILEHPTWNGIVVLDEAYIDFAPQGSSLAEWVTEWPNLVVMQTFSKAFGLAGIRLGAAYASPEIAGLLNNLKAPYNVSSPTSALACKALQPRSLEIMESNRSKLLAQRERMVRELPRIPGVGNFLGGSDANFLLVEILDRPREQGGQPDNTAALAVYKSLAESKGVVVRFRGKEVGCQGCLRITVGTEEEVGKLLREIRDILGSLNTGKGDTSGKQEERLEAESQRESQVVA